MNKRLILIATAIVTPTLASITFAAPTVVTIPGVPLPPGALELPALALSGSGSLSLPTQPASLPSLPALPVPLPSLPALPPLPASLPSGGSLSLSAGIGGPGYVIQPTTIAIDAAALPGLPGGGSTGSGNSLTIPDVPLPPGVPALPDTPIDQSIPLPGIGSITVTGGIGGADLIKATTISVAGLPSLPAP